MEDVVVNETVETTEATNENVLEWSVNKETRTDPEGKEVQRTVRRATGPSGTEYVIERLPDEGYFLSTIAEGSEEAESVLNSDGTLYSSQILQTVVKKATVLEFGKPEKAKPEPSADDENAEPKPKKAKKSKKDKEAEAAESEAEPVSELAEL